MLSWLFLVVLSVQPAHSARTDENPVMPAKGLSPKVKQELKKLSPKVDCEEMKGEMTALLKKAVAIKSKTIKYKILENPRDEKLKKDFVQYEACRSSGRSPINERHDAACQSTRLKAINSVLAADDLQAEACKKMQVASSNIENCAVAAPTCVKEVTGLFRAANSLFRKMTVQMKKDAGELLALRQNNKFAINEFAGTMQSVAFKIRKINSSAKTSLNINDEDLDTKLGVSYLTADVDPEFSDIVGFMRVSGVYPKDNGDLDAAEFDAQSTNIYKSAKAAENMDSTNGPYIGYIATEQVDGIEAATRTHKGLGERAAAVTKLADAVDHQTQALDNYVRSAMSDPAIYRPPGGVTGGLNPPDSPPTPRGSTSASRGGDFLPLMATAIAAGSGAHGASGGETKSATRTRGTFSQANGGGKPEAGAKAAPTASDYSGNGPFAIDDGEEHVSSITKGVEAIKYSHISTTTYRDAPEAAERQAIISSFDSDPLGAQGSSGSFSASADLPSVSSRAELQNASGSSLEKENTGRTLAKGGAGDRRPVVSPLRRRLGQALSNNSREKRLRSAAQSVADAEATGSSRTVRSLFTDLENGGVPSSDFYMPESETNAEVRRMVAGIPSENVSFDILGSHSASLFERVHGAHRRSPIQKKN